SESQDAFFIVRVELVVVIVQLHSRPTLPNIQINDGKFSS
ncbi:MAG: hypothetical protein ACI9R3_006172, partial [Verrucomicrobiales bacterium]